MGVHDIDAMQWIGRSRIARVYAQKREVLGNGDEDALYAVLEFENGAIGSLDYCWAWPDGLMNGFRSAFEIVGTRTAAALDVVRPGALLSRTMRRRPAATRTSGPRSTAGSAAASPTSSTIS